MENISVRIKKRFSKALGQGLFAVALLVLPALAYAQGLFPPQTTSENVTIMLDVEGTCSVALDTTQLHLGSTPQLATAMTATDVITVTCSPSLAYTVGIGPGVTGTVSARVLQQVFNSTGAQLHGSGQTLPYGIYQDAGYTTPWENTPSTEVPGTGNGSAQQLTAYFQVPSTTASISPGTYVDTIPVVVTY